MSASMLLGCLIGFVALFVISCGFEDEFEGLRTLTVEHSFDKGSTPEFSKRGTIVMKSVKNNKAHFTQNGPLSNEEKAKLKSLAMDNDVYRIRIPVKGTEDEEEYVSTFTLACLVYESSLTDQLILNVDQSGEVLGVSLMNKPRQCQGLDVPEANLTNWNTDVDIFQTVQGPTPDTQSYIEKIKREEMEKAKGQQGDNRSFFGKYWMYIVPFVIVMFLMQSLDPNQAGGGGGGGGGR